MSAYLPAVLLLAGAVLELVEAALCFLCFTGAVLLAAVPDEAGASVCGVASTAPERAKLATRREAIAILRMVFISF